MEFSNKFNEDFIRCASLIAEMILKYGDVPSYNTGTAEEASKDASSVLYFVASARYHERTDTCNIGGLKNVS